MYDNRIEMGGTLNRPWKPYTFLPSSCRCAHYILFEPQDESPIVALQVLSFISNFVL